MQEDVNDTTGSPVDSIDSEHAIHDLATCCRGGFTKILSAASQNAAVIERIPVLFKQPTDRRPILTIEDLRDEFQQFQLWSKNIGVFASDHRSLDYRLREARDVKEGILSLLQSMCSELAESES